MKEKILIFVIGLLLGAIISTGIIYLCINNKKINNIGIPEYGMKEGNLPDRQKGEKFERRKTPNDNNSQNNSETNNN